MKKLSTVLVAIVVAGLAGLSVSAQPPRIRTSAPAEKTAQKGKPVKDKSENKQAAPVAAKQVSQSTAPTVSSGKDIYMSLKTNLVYDIFGIQNLAYECQVAKHWTVELPVMWSLWDWKTSCGVRAVGLQPGAKYWFAKPGKGSAIGADFDLLWYNVRWDDTRYQVSGRPAMGASAVYAYTLNMGRGWKAEFSLGLGYINTRYNTYYNIENGALIDTRTKNYFGPTRVGLTLVYSL